MVYLNDLKINFSGWNIGGKLIFFGFILAVVSLFLPWKDAVIVTQNGIDSGGFILIPFFVYQVLWLLQDKEIMELIGIPLAIVPIVIVFNLIVNVNTTEVMGETVNVTGAGVLLALFSYIIISVGIMAYEPYDRDGTDDETEDNKEEVNQKTTKVEVPDKEEIRD